MVAATVSDALTKGVLILAVANMNALTAVVVVVAKCYLQQHFETL